MFLYDRAAEPTSLPCALGDVAPCHANEAPPPTSKPPEASHYRCAVFRELAKGCTCRGGEARHHDLLLRFRLPPAVLQTLPHRLVLRSVDGTILRAQQLSTAELFPSPSGAEVRFTYLPEAISYTLKTEGCDPPQDLLPGTPYPLLSSLGAFRAPTIPADDALALISAGSCDVV